MPEQAGKGGLIRFWSDFQAGLGDAYSILMLDGRRLDDAFAADLGLALGDRVMLFNDDDPPDSFQVEADLVEGDQWGWYARPDDDTFARNVQG